MEHCITLDHEYSSPSTFPLPEIYTNVLEIIEHPEPIELHQKGFSVLPLDSNCTLPSETLGHLYNVSISPRELKKYVDIVKNFGVLTGPCSKDLFVLQCQSQKSVERYKKDLGRKSYWISSCPEGYNIWLLSNFGTVKSKKFSEQTRIIGNRNLIVLPNSCYQSGEIITWIEKTGEYPPTIDEATMRNVFEHFKVSPSAQKVQKEEQIDCSQFLSDTELNRVLAEHIDWSIFGRTTTFKSLYLALLDRARKEKPSRFRASCREVGALSSLSTKTVTKNLSILISKNIIKIVEKSNNGNIYSLTNEIQKYHTTENVIGSVVLLQELGLHDVWTWHGFGSTGKNIAQYLIKTTQKGLHPTVKNIVDHTKHAKTTVVKRLKQMQKANLVWSEGNYWYSEMSRFNDLDTIAVDIQVSETLERKKRQRQDESRRYAENLLRRLFFNNKLMISQSNP